MLVMLAGAAFGWWVLQPEEAPSEPEESIKRGASARIEEPPSPSPEGSPSRPATVEHVLEGSSHAGWERAGDREAPTPDQVAFSEHARRAEVRWEDSVAVLSHAESSDFAEVAAQLARRMAVVGPTTPAPVRQELINEERQLIDVLQRRYTGVPPLMRIVNDLDADLQAVQDNIRSVGPSPDPRERSVRVGDGRDHK